MNWVIFSSSWLDAGFWDSGDLYLRFKDKKGRVTGTFHYADVPLEMWEGLLTASSKGGYFHASGLIRWPYRRSRMLTPKRQRFVEEYLVDGNGAAAYRRAGYKVKTDTVAAVEAHRLLSIPNVVSAIEAGRKARQERTESSQDRVIRRLWEEADYYGTGAGHSARVKALELLGRQEGMWPDRLQVEGATRLELVYEVVGTDGAAARPVAVSGVPQGAMKNGHPHDRS